MRQLRTKLSSVVDLLRPSHLRLVLSRHSEIGTLLSSDYFGNVLEISPRLTRQYLSTHLARSFNVKQRLRAVLHHHRAMERLFLPAFFQSLLQDGLGIWSRTVDADRFHMMLHHNALHHYEGDINLVFYRNDVILFQMSLALIDGREVGLPGQDVLYVGGGQGARPEHEELKHAVKVNDGVAPSHLVLAAVRGVAEAMGVDTIVGVPNAEQLTRTKPHPTLFTFNYDRFWPMFGGEQNERGFFVLPVQPFEKPLAEIPRTHRRRSRKKREYKAMVMTQCDEALLPLLRVPRPQTQRQNDLATVD